MGIGSVDWPTLGGRSDPLPSFRIPRQMGRRSLFRILSSPESWSQRPPVSGSVNDDTAAPACSEPCIESPIVDTWFWVVLLRALRFPPLFLTEKSPKRDHMRMRE